MSAAARLGRDCQEPDKVSARNGTEYLLSIAQQLTTHPGQITIGNVELVYHYQSMIDSFFDRKRVVFIATGSAAAMATILLLRGFAQVILFYDSSEALPSGTDKVQVCSWNALMPTQPGPVQLAFESQHGVSFGAMVQRLDVVALQLRVGKQRPSAGRFFHVLNSTDEGHIITPSAFREVFCFFLFFFCFFLFFFCLPFIFLQFLRLAERCGYFFAEGVLTDARVHSFCVCK